MQFGIRQLMLVTTYVAVGMWAVTTSFLPFGLVLPAILGGAMASHANRKRPWVICKGCSAGPSVSVPSALASSVVPAIRAEASAIKAMAVGRDSGGVMGRLC